MRAIVQRVESASVTVGEELISSIRHGILVLVGYSPTDSAADSEYMCRKLLNTKFFSAEDGKMWKRDVQGVEGEVLLVSQFTLYHRLKGNNLDFHGGMAPEQARAFHQDFVAAVQKAYRADRVKDGVFGAKMSVSLVNDGPVTITLESDTAQGKTKPQEPKKGKEAAKGGAAAQDPVSDNLEG